MELRMRRQEKALLAPALTAVVTALFATGCGDDSDDNATEAASVATTAPPAATAPPPTTTPAVPPTKTAPPAATPEPAAPTSAPNPCTTAKAISNLKFTGIPCAQAASVADEWNERIDDCNTIDDPNSPEGYNRICTVQTYNCRAKRDVKSDARFIACAKGSATVRFTWAPP
jgi:hypothetical protein